MSSGNAANPVSLAPTLRAWWRSGKNWAVGFSIFCGVVILVLQAVRQATDHALINVVTTGLLLLVGLVWLLWFMFGGRRPMWIRFTPILSLTLAALVASKTLRVEYVTGDLWPTVNWSWAKKRDQLLDRATAKPVSPTASAALTPASAPAEFPQFLGPQRNATVQGARLRRDWSRPPKSLWKQPIGAGWCAFSAVNGAAVTLEQRGPEELVTCYDVRTGRLNWVHAVEQRHETVLGGVGPRSTPSIHGGKVFAVGANGLVRCLNFVTGELIWSVDLWSRYGVTAESELKVIPWGRAGSPLVVDDLVIVPAGGGSEKKHVSLIALRQDSGDVVWEAGQHQISYSSPTLATFGGVRQVVIVLQDFVCGFDLADGRQLWEHRWPGKSSGDANSSQAVPLPNEQLLLSKAYGVGGWLLNVRSEPAGFQLDEVWHNRGLLKTKFTNVAVLGGHVYALSDSVLECVELASGQRKWKKTRFGQGQLLGVDDLLLVESEWGEVALVEASPARYRELGRFPAVQGKTWNNLCLHGPYLLIRNGEEAACYELPLAE